ncbi:tetratricopeptide repeat protein [Calothrix sp. NIES-4071]|nr:tetratricopeptide repeat protein [Calothrix sp. NIES-4071]BAZ59361.1 tetratricopeptide repeat protein [Calothrix sp. NIES-4105]
MNKNLLIIPTLLLLQLPAGVIKISSNSKAPITHCLDNIKPENPENAEYSQAQLQTLASQITVKVTGDNSGGSGTLLAKNGNTYLVLTNSHVVKEANSITLQTSDGKTYPAKIEPQANFNKYDLTLLKFETNQNYCVTQIEDSPPSLNTSVIAAGFSSEQGKIVYRAGKIEQITDSLLKEGYQIGYTSDIEQGMSGGAILNPQGRIIGINGKTAYPILNTGYEYQNGRRLSDEEIQRVRKLSWGIPILTVLAQVQPNTLTAYNLPYPKTPSTTPDIQYTGWLGDLEKKAKQFTVRIDSTSGANGSGVIIAKEGNTYIVLTAAHVVCERGKGEDATKPCGDFKYSVRDLNGKQYPVESASIKIREGVDLAVVKFTSYQNYSVATLADYNPNRGNYMFTAGYPKLGSNSSWRFTVGQVFSKELGLLATKESDFETNSSGRLQSASSLTGGYELVYTSITYGGMSGGPVLDSLGRVIGIHGRAEGEVINKKAGDGSNDLQVQIGYSLGIPTSTFIRLKEEFGVNLQIADFPAPPLNAQQEKSIVDTVLSADISKGNATATQWLERGNQLWRLRRYDEAVQAFDEAIKGTQDVAYLAYFGKGLALSGQRKYQEAATVLLEAVKLKPDYIAALQQQSLMYRYLNQPDKALVAINKAIQHQPKNPNLYNEKFRVLENLKRYSEAEIAITSAIKLSPRPAFYSNRGNVYADQKKSDLAIADFTKAIQINPQLAEAYSNRGVVYADQKKSDLAIADFTKAIQINPQLAEAYTNRGLVYKDQKKSDLAIADYTKAIQINPQDAQAYNNRGLVYADQEKSDLAIADYTEAIQINPQFADAYYNRAIVYASDKKSDLAIADFTKAIQINPQFTDAYIYRGNIYAFEKKSDLAIADFTKAIQINPQYAPAYSNRGTVYADQKKSDLAIADFTKAIQINPQFAKAYYNRGNVYASEKKSDLAIADFTKAIQINPQFATAYGNRGLVYNQMGDKQSARKDLQKAAQLFQEQNKNADYEKVMNILKNI